MRHCNCHFFALMFHFQLVTERRLEETVNFGASRSLPVTLLTFRRSAAAQLSEHRSGGKWNVGHTTTKPRQKRSGPLMPGVRTEGQLFPLAGLTFSKRPGLNFVWSSDEARGNLKRALRRMEPMQRALTSGLDSPRTEKPGCARSTTHRSPKETRSSIV